jgi:anti-anti-sigma factor
MSNGTRPHWDPPRRKATPFQLSLVEAGRAVLARVQGPLDLEHASHFLRRVQPYCEDGRRVVVDLTGADYVDSSGVRALLALKSVVDGVRGELRLIIPDESRARRTLSLLRLLDHFEVHASAAEAWNRD